MGSIDKLLLDSDTVSYYLRKQSDVVRYAQEYLIEHVNFSFSIITRFEILRGMKAKGATIQVSKFDVFCFNNEVLGIDDKIIVRASDIYASLRRSGKTIGDSDILIAATALENGLLLVTNNENHFDSISGLELINWTR
ncbi:MAG: type II toxin-antitoxin system VapC family toxin [Pyrinomonadaceae bacterium]